MVFERNEFTRNIKPTARRNWSPLPTQVHKQKPLGQAIRSQSTNNLVFSKNNQNSKYERLVKNREHHLNKQNHFLVHKKIQDQINQHQELLDSPHKPRDLSRLNKNQQGMQEHIIDGDPSTTPGWNLNDYRNITQLKQGDKQQASFLQKLLGEQMVLKLYSKTGQVRAAAL